MYKWVNMTESITESVFFYIDSVMSMELKIPSQSKWKENQ